MGEHRMLSSGAHVRTSLAVRTAGVPARALTSLRFDVSLAAAEEILDCRERLAADGAILADALYDVVGSLSGDSRKPGVVGLRRALHRARRPRAAEWSPDVASVLPDRLAHRIGRWVAERETLEQREAELPAVVADEETVKRAALRDLTRCAAFRRALSQASPTLFAEVSKWLTDDTHTPRRRSLVGLTKYAARAAAKTSPYSTFTVSGTGVWTDRGPTVRPAGAASIRGVLEIEGSLVQGLVRTLCTEPKLTRSLRVRVNPSVIERDDVIRFVGRPPRESIITMSATPAIRACLRILDADPDLGWYELRDSLATFGDAPADSIEPFLEGLVDAGLVERVSPVGDLSGDPFRELGAWLRTCGDQDVAAIVTLVDQVRVEARRDVAVQDVEGHDTRQRELVRRVGELAGRVSRSPRTGSSSPPGKWVFHENAVVTGAPAECSFPRWRPALEDLDTLRRWLAPFDPALPLRLALGVYVRERFGPGARVSILTLHRAIQEELDRRDAPDQPPAAVELTRVLHPGPGAAPSLSNSQLSRLRHLDQIQRQARTDMAGADPVDGIIHAAPDTLSERITEWPRWVAATGSLGYYVQVTGAQDTPSLVVNAAHCGYGRGHSRLAHLIGRAGGETPTDEDEPTVGAGTAPAEFEGLFSWSPNVRMPAAPYELEYPFTTSSRPHSQRIRTGDCVAVHDPATDLVKLRTESSGIEVVPLHLGMMADALLPPLARLLTASFGHGYYMYPSMALAGRDAGSQTPKATVESLPRVQLGNVVLRRAYWTAAEAEVPRHTRGETDTDYWLRLLEWLRAHAIPTRCFVRVLGDAMRADTGVDTRQAMLWLQDKSHKPVYIDFANWYLVLEFRRMVSDRGSVVFEEALPMPENANHPDRDPAVTEFLVEVSDTTRPKGERHE